MSNLVVGVSDCQWSTRSDQDLVTHALGSCIALVIFDPESKVGGMLHYMLPESDLNRSRAQQTPFMFADSGIPHLFRRAYELGADKRRLIVRAAGGAQVMADQEMFNIGKRNHLALRKILWKAGVMVYAEAIGGNVCRTVRLEMKSGRLLVREAAGPEQELELPKRIMMRA